MLYHASPIGGLSVLTPHVSNHGKSLVYLSSKRENVLVYLSNAVEKYCRENGFVWDGPWYKWASYGFARNGLLQLEEYYPNALIETYQGVSGYLYRAADCESLLPQDDVPDAFVSDCPVKITGCEFIPDAYEAILKAASAGLMSIKRYGDLSDGDRRWLEKVIPQEYAKAEKHPDYRFFLQSKFSFLFPS